jgi:hypothetical protein
MTYQIHLQQDEQIVHIVHRGAVDPMEMTGGKEGVFFYLRQFGWRKILLDLAVADLQVGATDVAAIFRRIDDAFPAGAFIAVVQPREMAFDFCRFAKSVAEAWSRTQLEVFGDTDAARGWLVNQPTA